MQLKFLVDNSSKLNCNLKLFHQNMYGIRYYIYNKMSCNKLKVMHSPPRQSEKTDEYLNGDCLKYNMAYSSMQYLRSSMVLAVLNSLPTWKSYNIDIMQDYAAARYAFKGHIFSYLLPQLILKSTRIRIVFVQKSE